VAGPVGPVGIKGSRGEKVVCVCVCVMVYGICVFLVYAVWCVLKLSVN
jgi:hypothetical protein